MRVLIGLLVGIGVGIAGYHLSLTRGGLSGAGVRR